MNPLNPWNKWSKVPTPELIDRLNDITSEVMDRVEEPDECTPPGRMTDAQLVDIMSEAHWITEEIFHRIQRTEWAGIQDIIIRPDSFPEDGLSHAQLSL